MMTAPPVGSVKGPLCPVCKKKPLADHSFHEQQHCVAEGRKKNIPI